MNLRRGVVLATRALMVITSLLLLSGCRQIVGIDDRQAFEGDASNMVACGLPTRGAACATCMATKCCEESQQCADDPLQQCLSNERCLQSCPVGDAACRLRCSKKWVSGPPAQLINKQTLLHDCRDRHCNDECGPWDCLGKVEWQVPDPFPPAITIRATARCARCGPTEIAANAGVHVSVCSTADPDCASELSGGDTKEDGSVSLTVATGEDRLSVFLNFHKEGWLDNLLLLNTPPLSYDFDVGVVVMDTLEDVRNIAANLHTAYNPDLAVVKLNISNCNLGPGTGIDVTWPQGREGLEAPPTIDTSFGDMSGWDAVAVNVPVRDPKPRLVARLKSAESQDAASAPLVANVNLVVRKGAITLAPFVTPTP